MNINLVNESKTYTAANFQALVEAAKAYVPLVTKAWGLGDYPVTTSNARDSKAWNVCVVDNFPNPAMSRLALGYHEVVAGMPIAYASQKAYNRPLGLYYKGLTLKGRVITKPRYSPGCATVALHEIAEMLVDPLVKVRKMDAQKRNWVVEICDHTKGLFKIDTSVAPVVAPDFTLPAFYEITTTPGTQLSYLNVPTAPFTLVPGGYGYQDVAGKMVKL